MNFSSALSQFALTVFLLAGLTGPLCAQVHHKNEQRYSLVFQGDSMREALHRLVNATGISLAYDPAIMNNHAVFVAAKHKKAEAILRLILQGSKLDFVRLSSGTYVLTRAPRRPIRHGRISGQVTGQRTGMPLVGANVMLADASGGAATDATGHFDIPKVQQGQHAITISYVGYQPVRDTVWVASEATGSLNFSLAPKPVLIEPIVVEGIQKRRPTARPLSKALHARRITSPQPLGAPDAVKSLNAVTGIDFNGPLADFNIQGGTAGGQQLRLDGVPIYNPVSMGHLLGAFSPWAIRKITVHKAGFGAPVGSQLSGVVNMSQDTGDSTEAPVLVQANPLNLNGRFTQQFGSGGHSIHVMLAGRTSIWQWYQQPAMNNMLQNWDRLDPLLIRNLFKHDSTNTFFKARHHAYNVNYDDLHAAVNITHSKFHQTKFSGYYGRNLLETNLTYQHEPIPFYGDPMYPSFYSFDHYNWINYMAKVSHDWLVTGRLSATFSADISHHSFDHNYVFAHNKQTYSSGLSYKIARNASREPAGRPMQIGDRNAITRSTARFRIRYQASNNDRISGGLKATHINYRFNLSDRYYNGAQSKAGRLLISGYLQNHWSLSRQISLTLGSRMTFVPSRDLVFAEPRLALKYDNDHTAGGYFSAKLMGGIYRQFITQFDVSNVGPTTLVPSLKFWAPVDYTTTVPKAYHIAVESLLQPTDSWEIRLGSYYKWIPARLALNYSQLSALPRDERYSTYSRQHQFISSARGYAYGINLSANKFIHPLDLQVQAGYQYSISRQRLPFQFGKKYEPLPDSQPHKVTLSTHWQILPRLTLLMQWKSIWGRSWGFRNAYYNYLSLHGDRTYGHFSFNDPGGDRLPRYSTLNAGLSYRLDIGKSALQFRFDIFNLLNHKNVINWRLTPYQHASGVVGYQRRARAMEGFRPSLSIKLSY